MYYRFEQLYIDALNRKEIFGPLLRFVLTQLESCQRQSSEAFHFRLSSRKNAEISACRPLIYEAKIAKDFLELPGFQPFSNVSRRPAIVVNPHRPEGVRRIATSSCRAFSGAFVASGCSAFVASACVVVVASEG